MDHLVFATLIFLISAVATAWTAGAWYWDVAHGAWWGWLVAGLWLAGVVALFVWTPTLSGAFLIFAVACGLFQWWWHTLEPRHDREWDPNFAQLPEVEVAGDCLTVRNVRNTEYRTADDYTVAYETRQFRLSQMQSVDLLLLYWGSPFMSHPMFVFDFGPDGHLCISLEVRYRVGQKYSFLKSLYRQQELMYVVSDERDAILRRTKCLAGHDLYLYRVLGNALELRQFFYEYANRINKLVTTPRWYHGITANCTTGIYAQGRGRIEWDWRMLFNGKLDQMFYERKRLDQSRPFEELKRLSWINEIANRAPAEQFGICLRQELAGYRPAAPASGVAVARKEASL